MPTAAAIRIVAGMLWLAARCEAVPAQVFEIGDDGAVRTAQAITSSAPAEDAKRDQPRPSLPSQRSEGVAAKSWTVQLGAYDSVALLDAAWRDMLQRHRDLLGGLPIVRSEAVVRGRRYYRLSVAGFEDLRAATLMCQTLRRQAGTCYVRPGEP